MVFRVCNKVVPVKLLPFRPKTSTEPARFLISGGIGPSSQTHHRRETLCFAADKHIRALRIVHTSQLVPEQPKVCKFRE